MKLRLYSYCCLALLCTMSNVCMGYDFSDLKLKEPAANKDLTFQNIWKPYGPAQVRNQSALKLSALEWLPDNPDTLPVGTFRTDFAITYANHWGDMAKYYLDGETARFELRFAFGVLDDLDFQFTYSGFWRGGGFLDGIIENIHVLISETQARRNFYPRDKLAFLLNPNDPDTNYVITDSDEGVGLGDITLRLRYQIISAKYNYRPALTFSAITKIPVGNANDHFTSRAFEFCGHFTLRQKLHKHLYSYYALGLTYTSADKIWEVDVRPLRWFCFVGLEWRLTHRYTLNMQYEWESGIARANEYRKMLSWSSNLVAIAVQWRPEIDRDYYIEFAMIENTLFHSNTPDIVLHLALKYFFQ